MGMFSVICFFIISGYLIFQSFQRSTGVVDYYWKRILRIYPALIVVLLLCVILGPFVYEGTVPYLKNSEVWSYIPGNLKLFQQQGRISGIFEDNPMQAINGSLWSIRYEIFMYILLSLLFFIRKIPTYVKAALILSFVILVLGNLLYIHPSRHYALIYYTCYLGAFFCAGAVLAAIKINGIKHKKIVLAVSSILLVASFYFGVFMYTNYILLPVVIITLGLTPIPYLCNIGKKMGDISYGVYIYGFPVQQTLVYYFKFNAMELMLPSLVISYLLAFCSWHLIEKKALELKKIHPKMIFSRKQKAN